MKQENERYIEDLYMSVGVMKVWLYEQELFIIKRYEGSKCLGYKNCCLINNVHY